MEAPASAVNPHAWRHAAALLAVALLTTLLAQACTPRHRMADERPPGSLATALPARIGSYVWDPQQAVLQPAPDVLANLQANYTETLGRAYIDGQGRRMMVSLAYVASSAHGTTVHRPEVCYPAQGFSVHGPHRTSLQVGALRVPVARAAMQRHSRAEPVTYWIVVGGVATASPWHARWEQLRYTLHGTVPDALLVRVSSIDGNAAQAYAAQARFIGELASALPQSWHQRLFGAPQALSF